ncbi:MAG: hypothetical protein OXJ90_29000 [Spirochaetaceae bacterium]|nr:hypothetical protein [Spirochaetaceae bacterium]
MAAALLSIVVSVVIFLQFLDLAATGVELRTGARALFASVAIYLLGLGELIAALTIWFAYARAAREGRLRATVLRVTLWEGLAALAYLPARLLVYLPVARSLGDRFIDAFRLVDLLQGLLGVILVATAIAVPWRRRTY